MPNGRAQDLLSCTRVTFSLPVTGGAGMRLSAGSVIFRRGTSAIGKAGFERGNLAGASESVLEALAGALQLDEAERAHLFDLARAASSPVRVGGEPVSRGSGPASTASSTP